VKFYEESYRDILVCRSVLLAINTSMVTIWSRCIKVWLLQASRSRFFCATG